jgi:hypothetical protein
MRKKMIDNYVWRKVNKMVEKYFTERTSLIFFSGFFICACLWIVFEISGRNDCLCYGQIYLTYIISILYAVLLITSILIDRLGYPEYRYIFARTKKGKEPKGIMKVKQLKEYNKKNPKNKYTFRELTYNEKIVQDNLQFIYRKETDNEES